MLNVIYALVSQVHYAERRYAKCRFAECRGTFVASIDDVIK